MLAQSPYDGEIFFITTPADDASAQELLSSFKFTDYKKLANLFDGWKTYNNSKFLYSVTYPPDGEGPKMATDDLYTTKHTSVNEYDSVNIGTPRGKFGIIVMATSSSVAPGYSYEQQGAGEEFSRLVALDLKSFAKEVFDYNRSMAGSETKKGPDTRQMSSLKEELISGKDAFSMTISQMTWFYATAIWEILIPGNGGSYTYTFLENSKGVKYLLWYPSDDPTFERMKDSFVLK